MIELGELQAQYVTNEAGHRLAVILPIDVLQQLVKDLEVLGTAVEGTDALTASYKRAVELHNRLLQMYGPFSDSAALIREDRDR